ncbi:MAG: BrnA antitoxin family protein [Candidatus Firestonebacteria bacterium]
MKNTKIKKYRTKEDKEREYWAVNDSTVTLDWSKAKKTVFPNLKPTYLSISLRMPRILLEDLKMIANRRDIPYQSLMKSFIAERVKRELVHK